MNTKRLTTLAIMLSLALIFSYVEYLVPIPLPVPGIKLGLANIVIVFALYKMSAKDALILSVLRVVLTMALFGNPAMAMYSLSGSLTSLLGMTLLKKAGCFSLIGVSLSGGALHNIAQVFVAAFVSGTAGVISYMAILIPVGMAVGALNGMISEMAIRNLSGHRAEEG